jgi:hypothetical protein
VVPTYPLSMAMEFWHVSEDKCFFAPRSEKKDGKQHRYFSVVENRRMSGYPRQICAGSDATLHPARARSGDFCCTNSTLSYPSNHRRESKLESPTFRKKLSDCSADLFFGSLKTTT